MGHYQLIKEQNIPCSQEEIWDYISSPRNLSEITPDHMNFDIISKDLPEKMYAGMIIVYKVNVLPGVRMKWMTEITMVREGSYFIDEQRVGPYKMWHHQHILREIEGGVNMKDIITYIPPFGFIGSILNGLVIRKEIENIFKYRFHSLEEKFGKWQDK